MAQQPDGRTLAGGWFTTLDGTRQNFARLEGDGSIDESFAGELSANSTVQAIVGQVEGWSTIYTLLLQPNGQLLADGTLAGELKA